MCPQDYGLVLEDGDPFMELMAGIQTDDDFDLEHASEENGMKNGNLRSLGMHGQKGVSWRVLVEYSNGISRICPVMTVSLWISRKNCITTCQNILCRKNPNMFCTGIFYDGRNRKENSVIADLEAKEV